MVVFLGKTRIRLIFASYLALAVFGTFTFASIAPLRSIDWRAEEPISSTFFTAVNHTIDCLAEDSTVVSKSRGYSCSSPSYGQARAAMPPGIYKTAAAVLFSRLKTIEKITYSHIKNTILLKLRI
ncbi:MAG: hypothetical protein LBB61_07380 [Treponema sp.]|jgi:hypothetical protein|nr:hypothetical protein [Treponema sp.]